MTIELNRTTFKRLVWLYIATSLLAVAASLPHLLSVRWFNFGEVFDQLVAEEFGSSTWSDTVWLVVGVGLLGLVIWMVASIFGLFYFRRWARFGVWASVVLLLVISVVIFRFRPIFGSIWDDVAITFSSALLGAIVLMAYAKGLGDEWFATPAAIIKD